MARTTQKRRTTGRTHSATTTGNLMGGSLTEQTCNFIWRSNAPMPEKLALIGHISGYNGAQASAGDGGAAMQRQRAAPTQQRQRRAAPGNASVRMVPRRVKATKALSQKGNALLNYMQQHPTATYTAKQIAQVSPFSSWGTAKTRERSIAATARGLIRSGAFTKNGNGFSLTQVRQAA